MADRIVLNTISYHGHGAIENIVPELTASGTEVADEIAISQAQVSRLEKNALKHMKNPLV